MAVKYRPRSPDRVISALGAAQHGVVARRQLLAEGVSRDAIALRVHDGRLHPLHRGVYAVGRRNVSLEGKWLAAVLACGPEAVLSHRSAAALWTLRPTGSGRIEVSAPRTARGRAGLTLHRPRRLDSDERTVSQGVPVTTVSRTVTDLADVVGPRVLRKVLEQAEFLRLDASPVPIPGRRGTDRLTRALAAHGPLVQMTRSELEDRFLALCREAGLPTPLANTVVGGMEVDFCWPDHHVIVETDGWRFHGTRTAFERDRRRTTRLQLAGWIVVRFTYDDVVRHPGYVVASLWRLLASTVGDIRRA
jgi:hypothetical protein